MDVGTIAQIVLTSIIATATTLFVQARQERERVSCFVDWSFDYDEESGVRQEPYIGIHNRSLQSVAIHSIRWVARGILLRRHIEGTALQYEDPFDLGFPYRVEPGQILSLTLDQYAAKRLAEATPWPVQMLLRASRRHRILLEVRTTAQTRLLIPAEGALPWDERIPSARL